jgi:dTDP-glucose 4,6-dehydratase
MIAIVTGGAGFIGSELVRQLLATPLTHIVVFDCLSYAGNLENLPLTNGRLSLEVVDISDATALEGAWRNVRANYTESAVVYHLAAESHVDRSILSGEVFTRTNVLGTQLMLESSSRNNVARFLHVSTDEVYGSLKSAEAREDFILNPSSAYSASKAGSDLAVIAHQRTHNLDTLITRCVNNFGPNQMPEKFIPRMVNRAIRGRNLPIYGDGENSREWIHVSDHVKALISLMELGETGEIYNIGTGERVPNLQLAENIIKLTFSNSRIEFVDDRKGHDFRYAVDSHKIHKKLDWRPQISLLSGLAECILEIKRLAEDFEYQQKVLNMEMIYGKN